MMVFIAPHHGAHRSEISLLWTSQHSDILRLQKSAITAMSSLKITSTDIVPAGFASEARSTSVSRTSVFGSFLIVFRNNSLLVMLMLDSSFRILISLCYETVFSSALGCLNFFSVALGDRVVQQVWRCAWILDQHIVPTAKNNARPCLPVLLAGTSPGSTAGPNTRLCGQTWLTCDVLSTAPFNRIEHVSNITLPSLS